MQRSALFLAVFLTPATSLAAEKWVEVNTPHFVVVSNHDAEMARAVAERFERIRLVMQGTFKNPRMDPPEVPIIYAVRGKKEMKVLMPESFRGRSAAPAGLFRHNGHRVHVLMNTNAGLADQRFHTIYHEYFHLAAGMNAPWLPLWLNEGLATLWGTAELENDQIEIGRPLNYYIDTLRRKRLIPLEEFLAVDTNSDWYRRHGEAAVFYGQAFALVHYLMLEDPDKNRLELLLRYLSEGQDAQTALQRATGQDLDGVEKNLKAYVRRFSFKYVYMDARIAGSANWAVRELSATEVALRRADCIAWGARPDRALPFLKAASAAEGGLAGWRHEISGFVAMRTGHPAAAQKAFAAAGPRASHLALFYSALMSGEKPENARQLLERSVDLNGDFAPSRNALAVLHLRRKDYNAAAAAALRAHEIEPDNPDYALSVARVFRTAGHGPEARTWATTALVKTLRFQSANRSNLTCWRGALYGFASELMPACDHAVRLDPKDAAARDSRGLARALTGNHEGATEDFEFFVTTHAEDEKKAADVAVRRRWVERLAAKKPVLTPEELETLRAEIDPI